MCHKTPFNANSSINYSFQLCKGGALPENEENKSYLETDKNTPAFLSQLSSVGLEIRDIIGDGNCLFRALADQMDGNCNRHDYYRRRICDYIEMNRNDFEPFIVDKVKFQDYVNNLRQLGTYAGNDAIAAFSKLYGVDIVIHQLNREPMVFNPENNAKNSHSERRELHISYHNNEHYASVRALNDNSSQPSSFTNNHSSFRSSCIFETNPSSHNIAEKMEFEFKPTKRKTGFIFNSEIGPKKPKSI